MHRAFSIGMTTALLYLRVSTARQAEEGVSLDMQEARGRALAASRGWTVGGVYRDDGISGTEDPTGRPGLQALLDAASADPDAVVVVYSISRLSRRQRLLWALLDPAKGKGLAVASVSEPFDTSTPMGRAMIGMIGVWAQLESDQTSERTKAALAHVRASGTRLGAKPMAELAPEAVARCKTLAAEGLSLEAIAASLNDGGVSTATGRGKWWPKTVRAALAVALPAGTVRAKEVGMTPETLRPCPKCNATGVLRNLMHVDNGRCFECDGAGTIEATAPVARRRCTPVTQDRVERAVLDLVAMLRNAKAYGRGFALIDADATDAHSVGRTIAGCVSVLPAARRTKCLACFAAVLGAEDMAEIESALARIAALPAGTALALPKDMTTPTTRPAAFVIDCYVPCPFQDFGKFPMTHRTARTRKEAYEIADEIMGTAAPDRVVAVRNSKHQVLALFAYDCGNWRPKWGRDLSAALPAAAPKA